MNLKPILISFLAFQFCFLGGQGGLDSLLQLANSSQGEEKAGVLYEISGEYMYEDPDSALYFLNQAEDLLGEDRSSEILPSVLLRKCYVYKSLNDPENSLINCRQAFQLFKAHNVPDKLASTGLTIGNIYFRLGDFSRALEYYIESLEAFEQVGNISRVAHLHNNLGTVSHETGDLETAERLFEALFANQCFMIWKTKIDNAMSTFG